MGIEQLKGAPHGRESSVAPDIVEAGIFNELRYSAFGMIAGVGKPIKDSQGQEPGSEETLGSAPIGDMEEATGSHDPVRFGERAMFLIGVEMMQ